MTHRRGRLRIGVRDIPSRRQEKIALFGKELSDYRL